MEKDTGMEVEFVQTRSDVEKMMEELIGRESRDLKKSVYGYVVIALFIIIAGYLFLSAFGDPKDPLGDPFSIAILIMWLILAVYITLRLTLFRRKTCEKIARNNLRGKNIDSYLGRNTIRIDPKGIHRKNRYRNEGVSWDGITGIAETEDHIFINDTDVSAYIIPKRAFGTKKEMINLLNLVDHYMKKSR